MRGMSWLVQNRLAYEEGLSSGKYLSTLKITHSKYVPQLDTEIIHGACKSAPVDFIKQSKAKLILLLIKHYFM
jgi:hypothetical protein